MRLFSLAVLLVLTSSTLGAPAEPQNPIAPAAAPPVDVEQALESAPRGSLAIRAVQGTKGAPEVGASEVTVEFYHRDQVIQSLPAKLDEQGIVVIGDIPLAMAVRPIVRIKYADVLYQEAGPVMDAAHKEASVNVTVYQTTDEAPDWRVVMRHIMTQPTPDGLAVSEMVVVENPGDRTWLGGPADAQGRRPVVGLTLPADAREVHLDAGFHGWCCTQFAGRDLTVQMPLMPGRAKYRFSYFVPAKSGVTDLRFGAKARCDHAMILAPDDSSEVAVSGVQAAASDASQGMPGVRAYQANNVEKDAPFGVTITRAAFVPSTVSRGASGSWAMFVGAGVAGCITLVCVVLLVRRMPHAAKVARQ